MTTSRVLSALEKRTSKRNWEEKVKKKKKRTKQMMFYDFGRKFQGIFCGKMKMTEAWEWESLNLSSNSATSLVCDLEQVSEPVWAPKSWSGSDLWVMYQLSGSLGLWGLKVLDTRKDGTRKRVVINLKKKIPPVRAETSRQRLRTKE